MKTCFISFYHKKNALICCLPAFFERFYFSPGNSLCIKKQKTDSPGFFCPDGRLNIPIILHVVNSTSVSRITVSILASGKNNFKFFLQCPPYSCRYPYHFSDVFLSYLCHASARLYRPANKMSPSALSRMTK